jgi:deoxycytidylate deaminase
MDARRYREAPARDEYFMGLAHLIAIGSANPAGGTGALVTDSQGRQFATGTDCLPAPVAESLPWEPDLVIHAEAEALRRARFALAGGVLYVTRRPCLACLCEALHAGVSRVFYSARGPEPPGWGRLQEVTRLSYMQVEPFRGDINWLRDQVKVMERDGVFG